MHDLTTLWPASDRLHLINRAPVGGRPLRAGLDAEDHSSGHDARNLGPIG